MKVEEEDVVAITRVPMFSGSFLIVLSKESILVLEIGNMQMWETITTVCCCKWLLECFDPCTATARSGNDQLLCCDICTKSHVEQLVWWSVYVCMYLLSVSLSESLSSNKSSIFFHFLVLPLSQSGWNEFWNKLHVLFSNRTPSTSHTPSQHQTPITFLMSFLSLYVVWALVPTGTPTWSNCEHTACSVLTERADLAKPPQLWQWSLLKACWCA